MIREATEADLPELLAMGHRFISESRYREFILDNGEQLEKLAKHLLANPQGRVLVSQKNGELVGMLGMIVFPHHFSGELTGGEVFWWVQPEEREGGAGLKLLRHAERLASSLGANKMQMVAPTERIEKLYEALGYKKVETTYQRNL